MSLLPLLSAHVCATLLSVHFRLVGGICVAYESQLHTHLIGGEVYGGSEQSGSRQLWFCSVNVLVSVLLC